MPKERTINPAAQQRKDDKRKAVAKSKKQVQVQRNEKLAKRNPARLQAQIDELKALDGSGSLRPKDRELLGQLERDLKGINRAREALGDAAPKFSFGSKKELGVRDQQKERRAQLQQHLGKRRRGREDAHESGSDTDPEVRLIPMPRDTPPPIPRDAPNGTQTGPDGTRLPHALPAKPAALPAQIVYSSAPQLRDLKKEAIRFMPAAVQAHKAKIKGQGKLLEPEEMDRLEKAGYLNKIREEGQDSEPAASTFADNGPVRQEDPDADTRLLEQQLAALERQIPGTAATPAMRHVHMDEVQDDGT